MSSRRSPDLFWVFLLSSSRSQYHHMHYLTRMPLMEFTSLGWIENIVPLSSPNSSDLVKYLQSLSPANSRCISLNISYSSHPFTRKIYFACNLQPIIAIQVKGTKEVQTSWYNIYVVCMFEIDLYSERRNNRDQQ